MTKRRLLSQPPRLADDGVFRDAFLRADYARCMRILQQAPQTAEVVLKRCEVLLREREYADVVEILSAFKPVQAQDAASRDMLLGVALAYTKEYDRGRTLFLRARSAMRAGDPRIDDAQFYLAMLAWMLNDNATALAELEQPLKSTDFNARARARILESWVKARRHDLEAQAQSLVSALRDLDACDQPDEYYRTNALTTLALLCRELPLTEMAQFVKDLYQRIAWTDSLSRAHFQTTRFLGWIECLEGNDIAAFRYFKDALALAPSDEWKVLCHLDRAVLARSRGEEAFALDQLNDAEILSRKVRWAQTEDEERSGLILLAELLADVDPAAAQRHLAEFRKISSPVLPTLAYATDPRVTAFARYSTGIALLRLGDVDEAQTALRDAWEVFEDFHYGWRAALTALGMYECTSDERWLARAEQRVKPWPRSWVARYVRRAAAQTTDMQSLPAAQRQVLELLLRGASNAQIAGQLGRSPHTIRNQVAVLFQRYKVKSRTQLAAKMHQTL